MTSMKEGQIAHRVSELLTKTLSQQVSRVSGIQNKVKADLVLRAGPYSFVVECKSSGAAGPVAAAIERLKKEMVEAPDLIPVVAVPFMGEVGRSICAKTNVNWIDLSGNAHLSAPGLLVHVEGRPNLFKTNGRPADVFAPKSSRIVRALLTNYHSAWSIDGLEQRTNLGPVVARDKSPGIRELAKNTDMDPGLTSRVVARLEADGLIQGMRRKSDGRLEAVRATNPGLLLDAWRADYKFFRHDVLQGHVAARAGDELLREMDRQLRRAKIKHAATGLGAAWLYTHFADFRLVTFYVSARPESFLKDIGFRREPSGANIWLVIPNDEGVFQETRTAGNYDGGETDIDKDIECVHPVQVYIDLKDHPERAEEAATELRNRLLGDLHNPVLTE
jgi:DNA-binding MarR family transcriptional regulator